VSIKEDREDAVDAELIELSREHFHEFERTPPKHASRLQCLEGIHAVMFDVGDTLILSRPRFPQQALHNGVAFGDALEQEGIYLDDPSALLEETWRRVDEEKRVGLTEHGRMVEPSGFTIWREVLRDGQLRGCARGLLSERTIRRAFIRYWASRFIFWPTSGIAEALAYLGEQSIRAGIISNAWFNMRYTFPAAFGGKSAEQLGFSPNLIFWSCDLGVRKPGKEIFRAALTVLSQTYEINASETLYVGNDFEMDMVPALQLGIRTALLGADRFSLKLPDSEPDAHSRTDVFLHDLQQLREVIPARSVATRPSAGAKPAVVSDGATRSSEPLLKPSLFAHTSVDGQLWNDLYCWSCPADPDLVAILRDFQRRPSTVRRYLASAGPDHAKALQLLLDQQLLVPTDLDEVRVFHPRRVVIETVRHCNARCRYCPQSVAPKDKAEMEMEVFERVVDRLSPYNPSWVAFVHYGETLLDRQLDKRLAHLTSRGHAFMLYSNASLLTDELIQLMSDAKMHGAWFNFPSLDPIQWASFMQLPSRQAPLARTAIERFIARFSGQLAELGIVVNALNDDHCERTAAIEEHFRQFGEVTVIRSPTNTRAGNISGELVGGPEPRQQPVLHGCDYAVSQMHVSWEGKCFLCCHDYHQENILGDLLTQDIQEIYASELACQLRSEIFGVMPMAQQRLCRKCDRIRDRKLDL